MARLTHDGETIVYRYGCPARIDLPDEAMEQLRLAYELRCELVAMERGYDAHCDQLWSLIPDVAKARQAVDDAVSDEDRATAIAALKTAKHRHRKLYKRLRRPLDEARRAALGRAEPEWYNTYRMWVERGLAGSTCTRIIERHIVASKAVVGQRAAGVPAQHRWPIAGVGTLTTQIKFGSHLNRHWWQLIPADDNNPRHYRLRLRFGRGKAGPLWIELPIAYHRPLPNNAVVTWGEITRRLVAGRPRLSVALTVQLPPVAEKITGDVVDVDLGWASAGTDVGLRVARVSTASGTLPPPPVDIADLVTVGDWYEIWFPARWRNLLARDAQIHANRAHLLDELRPGVVEALKGDTGLVEAVGFMAAQAAVMGFGKYVRLAKIWPAGHITDPTVHAALLNELRNASAGASYLRLAGRSTPALWQMRDRHLWSYEVHERAQVLDRRRDVYRKVAAWICDAARVVFIREVRVAQLRRRPSPVDDSPQAKGSRRQIQVAAPAELKRAIDQAAARRGVAVRTYTEVNA